MVTMVAKVTPQALTERLEKYHTTLRKLESEGADKRIILGWKSRITKMESELSNMSNNTATNVDQDDEEITMPPKVQDKPQSARDKAKAKQTQVAEGKGKTSTKATTATPTKPDTKATPAKQTPAKPAPTTQKPVSKVPAGSSKLGTVNLPHKVKAAANGAGSSKGVPGKNNVQYPDLNVTDPTFGGRGTTHCMCGCGEQNRRGGKFASGHDNRLRMLLGRIENGLESGESIAESTLVDLRENRTLSVGQYTAANILKLATRRPRKAAAKK